MLTAVSICFLSGSLDSVNYTRKIQFFFSEYPIVHTGNLTTIKSSARAEGPTIVLRMEKVTGVSIVLTPIRWKLTADATTGPLQALNHLCLGGPERPPIHVTQVPNPNSHRCPIGF